MANLRRWSTTASGNASIAGGAATINFAEGQLPSTVNNSAREMMAQLRSVYTPDEWGWVETSATASVASQTTFKMAGDQTSFWTAGRRWRLKSGSTTRYGAVVSASYTAETTVTVTVDSGSLSASHTLAALSSLTDNHLPATLDYVTSAGLTAALAPYISSNSVSVMIAASLTPYASSNSVSSMITTRLASYASSNSVSAMIATQVAAGVGGCTTVALETAVSSGSTVSITNSTITRAYKAFKIIGTNISQANNSSAVVLRISGNNGSGTTTIFTESVASSATAIDFVVDVVNCDSASGNRPWSAVIENAGTVTFATGSASVTTGDIDHISIVSGTSTFDGSGTITVIGYY